MAIRKRAGCGRRVAGGKGCEGGRGSRGAREEAITGTGRYGDLF